MATNRHAQIRYTILDRCFSNFNRLYNYDDLLEEINNVLYELGTEGVKLRQLQYDIEHMKSDAGWAIELIEGLKKERKKAFRYKDKNFSIANHPLNVNDSEQLETTLAILSRYKHREEFNWLEELIPRMEQAFDLVAIGDNGAIGYQENIDLKGRGHVGTLFNLILKRKKVKLIYEPYGKPQQQVIICPYYLKQYNNRWFLFCFNEVYQSISNYPLDRIVSIIELADDFDPLDINWMDYFEDVIGVTKPEESKVELIKLKFSENRINYVVTKPIHGTQKIDNSDETGNTITIEVIPNPELYQLLLSFGADIEVISPSIVRDELIEKIRKMNKIY
ncbi:helix-turn-helix transcriptional regulator [Gaetbulibacter saemankumensis]|uniref:helix-turn-helix transcriptional regulator n=1 Tax=Gaetbulibacter saemankumensis TaxID=311208 RepID=UPI000414E475|nr:WYL domain-containing protein [Gaetbulibacter saemankumensis]